MQPGFFEKDFLLHSEIWEGKNGHPERSRNVRYLKNSIHEQSKGDAMLRFNSGWKCVCLLLGVL